MTARSASFRIGRVRAFPRGRVWYLAYYELGKRRHPQLRLKQPTPCAFDLNASWRVFS